jgi:hypothetical protein
MPSPLTNVVRRRAAHAKLDLNHLAECTLHNSTSAVSGQVLFGELGGEPEEERSDRKINHDDGPDDDRVSRILGEENKSAHR